MFSIFFRIKIDSGRRCESKMVIWRWEEQDDLQRGRIYAELNHVLVRCEENVRSDES